MVSMVSQHVEHLEHMRFIGQFKPMRFWTYDDTLGTTPNSFIHSFIYGTELSKVQRMFILRPQCFLTFRCDSNTLPMRIHISKYTIHKQHMNIHHFRTRSVVSYSFQFSLIVSIGYICYGNRGKLYSLLKKNILPIFLFCNYLMKSADSEYLSSTCLINNLIANFHSII